MRDTPGDDAAPPADEPTPRNRAVVREWQRDRGECASVAVVVAVADALDVDPLTLPPLARRVDPDELDDLLAHASNVSVRFTYATCRVRVTSRGTVHVRPDSE